MTAVKPTGATYIKVVPRPPRMPNFLSVPTVVGVDVPLSVGALSDEDASALWDEWKKLWMEHVAKKREELQP